jgi:hypothetical protein
MQIVNQILHMMLFYKIQAERGAQPESAFPKGK